MRKLYIKNYILIDELSIDFSRKMNVITGETGAGKSIIIGAVSLLLGERASAPRPLVHSDKIILEGVFETNPENQKVLKPIFATFEWEWEDEIIIRREFNSQGKSRVFINDSPVRLGDVQQISPLLVELHQQFDHLSVRSEDFQLEVLDAMADCDLSEYRMIYKSWMYEKARLQELITRRDEARKESDYKKFILDELEKANFQIGEIEELENKLRLVHHTENVIEALQSANFVLQESEESVITQISAVTQNLKSSAKHLEKLHEMVERLESVHIELQDISDTIEQLGAGIDWSQEEVEVWTDRLDMANRLLTKHQVRNTEGLLNLQNELSLDLIDADDTQDQIEKLQKTIADKAEELSVMAHQLSKKRKKVTPSIEERMHELLAKIGMEKAQIKIQIEEKPIAADGKDKVQFLIDANQTDSFERIGKAASGGELNRIMLALKSIVAQRTAMPTLIFDEIDSGISGEPARQVGVLMRQLASEHQVITITHQASIAAQGDMHWYIFKNESTDSTSLKTRIRSIQGDEREAHIAELIGGKAGGESALAAAKKLLAESDSL